MTNQPTYLIAFILLFFTVGIGFGDRSEDPRPNIIFFLADDWGMDQVGAYGSVDFAIDTPNIDRLAKEGLLFINAYAAAVCGPTRGIIMNGMHPFRGDPEAMPKFVGNKQIHTLMQDAGYVAGALGKTDGNGWDEIQNSGYDPWADTYQINGVTMDRDERWQPQIDVDFARDFITRHKDSPFYFYYAFFMPHIVSGGSPNRPGGEDKWPATPTSAPDATREDIYHEYIQYIDKYIGDVVTHLESLGLAENTVIVIGGDNGTAFFKSPIGVEQPDGSVVNRMLDGGKRSLGGGYVHDGGVHLPLIVSWPAEISEPRKVESFAHYADLLTTFVSLAEGEPEPGITYDGIDLAPLFRGEVFEEPRFAFAQTGSYWFYRTHEYRLDHDGRFYDVQDLPFSMTEILPGTETTEQLAAKAELQAQIDKDKPNEGPSAEFARDRDDPEAEPYLSFKEDNFGKYFDCRWDPLAGDKADPDMDGLPNLFEMAFGFDPETKNEAVMEFTEDNGRLQVSYPEPTNPYVHLEVEVSSDLENWATDPEAVEIIVNNGTILARDRNPNSTGTRFIRVRASRTQSWKASAE